MAVEVEAHKVLFATTLMLVERGELQGTGVLCWWEVGGGADRLPGREAGRQAGRQAIAACGYTRLRIRIRNHKSE